MDRVLFKAERLEPIAYRLFFTFCLFTFALGLTGCALWEPRGPEPPQEATLEQLTKLLKVREQDLQTVKGLFTAEVRGAGIPIPQTVYGTLFYRRPDAFRLQGFNRFGGMLFDLALEPGVYHLRVPKEGKSYQGAPRDLDQPNGLSEPLRLSILAMQGLIGIEAVGPDQMVVLAEDQDLYRLDVHGENGESATADSRFPFRRIWFDRRSLQVVREDRLGSNGEVEGTLRLEDFRHVQQGAADPSQVATHPSSNGPLILPFKITAEAGGGEGKIQVTFQELVPNLPLGDKELRLAFTETGGDNRG